MIYREERMIVNFEGGDIEVAGGHNGKVGYIKLGELDQPQEIGTKPEIAAKCYPVVMAFKNTKSIDAVIKVLNHIKKKMEESEEEGNNG